MTTIFPIILTKYADTFIGIPYEVAEDVNRDVTTGIIPREKANEVERERWRNILMLIVTYCKEANEETCSKTNDINIKDDPEAYIKKETDICKYRDDCKNKALDMIKEWFWELED